MAHFVFLSPVITSILELVELAVRLTESKKDDGWVKSLRSRWDKVNAFVRLFPQINIPVAAWATSLAKFVFLIATVVKNARKAKAREKGKVAALSAIDDELADRMRKLGQSLRGNDSSGDR
jgi:hypothetical protein